MVTIDLNELVDAFGLQSDFLVFFIEKKTGEIAALTGEEIERIEQGESSEDLALARKVLLSDQYVELPEIDKKEIMESFCLSLEEGELQDSFLEVAGQEGAFEYFGTTAYLYQKEDEWLAHVQERLNAEAIAWCKEQGLSYKQSPRNEKPEWL